VAVEVGGSPKVVRAESGRGGGTKAERMAAGTAFSFGSMLVVRLASILNSIVVVRILGLYNLGVYSIVILTVSVASMLASFGVPQAMVKFLSEAAPDNPEEARRLLGAGVVTTLAATSLTVSVLALVSSFLASLYNESRISNLLLVASIGLTFTAILAPVVSTFQAYELIREIGVRNMVSAALSVPATVGFVLIWGLEGAVLATVVNSAVAVVVNVSLLRAVWRTRRLSLEIQRSFPAYRKILTYAIPALGSSLLVAPVLWFASTYLATQSSFVEVGRYSVGLGLASYLLFIPSAIGMPMVPIVSRLDRSKPHELSPFMTQTVRVGAFLLIPPASVLIAFPEPFLALLYGSASVTAAPIVRVLAPAVFLAGVSSIVGYGIAGKGRMWEGLVLNLYWAVVLVVGCIFLVPTGFAIGLSLAYLAAYVAHFVGVMAYVRYSWSMALRPLGAPVLIAVASFSAVTLAGFIGIDPWRLPVKLALIVSVVVAEYLAMSRREFEVISGPIRKILLWIGPSQ